MPESKLTKTEWGLLPTDKGWFVVNARESFWLEREGLPDDVVAACDETATIQLAEDAESLNVAVAGAIALYEHRRGS